VLALVLGLALAGVALLVGMLAWSRPDAKPGPPRAAIVDQLALTDPNPEFVAAATRELQSAGYVVEYYKSELVTVDFYRSLPRRSYEFILLRSHASESIGKIDPRPASSRASSPTPAACSRARSTAGAATSTTSGPTA